MPSFAPVPEQLARLESGVVDLHRARRARAAARGVARERAAAAGQGRLRSHAARPAHRPRRAAAEDAGLPGPRAHGHLSHRRLHRDGGRPDRAQREPPAPHARRGRPLGRDLPRAGVQGPRPPEGRAPAQQRVARRDDDGRRRVDSWRSTTVSRMLERKDFRSASTSSAPSTSTSFSTRSCRATTRWPSNATWSSAAPTSSSTCSSAAT